MGIQQDLHGLLLPFKGGKDLVGKGCIKIRRNPYLAFGATWETLGGLCREGHQARYGFPRFGKDNLIALLYHFDKRGEFSLGLRDITYEHNEIISDQIWSGQPSDVLKTDSIYRMRYISVYKDSYAHGILGYEVCNSYFDRST